MLAPSTKQLQLRSWALQFAVVAICDATFLVVIAGFTHSILSWKFSLKAPIFHGKTSSWSAVQDIVFYAESTLYNSNFLFLFYVAIYTIFVACGLNTKLLNWVVGIAGFALQTLKMHAHCEISLLLKKNLVIGPRSEAFVFNNLQYLMRHGWSKVTPSIVSIANFWQIRGSKKFHQTSLIVFQTTRRNYLTWIEKR